MKDRQAFLFYRSYYDTLKEIHEEGDKLIFLLAILEKQFEDKEPILEGIPKLCYASQKYNIDKQVEGWKSKTYSKKYPTQDPSVGSNEGSPVDPSLQEQEQEQEQEKEKQQIGVGLLFDSSMEEFYKFVKLFPQGKANYSSDSIEIWNHLSARDKQLCLQLTPHYIEHSQKTGKEIYIKNVNKFLEDGFYKQLNENQSRYLGKKILINSVESDQKVNEKEMLRKMIWGN